MKAAEVLRQYAEGRRNFRKENLRCLSFKGKDLSGADFSETDIRGTNFSKANLTGAKFMGAKAGLPKRWVITLLLGCLLLLVISTFLARASGIFVSMASLIFPEDIAWWVIIIVFLAFNSLLIYRGISGLASAIAIAITIASAFSIVISYIIYPITIDPIASVIASVFAIANITMFANVLVIESAITAIAIVITVTNLFAITIANVFAIASNIFAIASTIAIAIASASASALAFNSALALARSGGFDSDVDSGFSLANSCIYLSIALYSYLGWRAIKGDARYTWIRTNAIDFSITGGTSFRNANLTDTDFTKATLKNTDFRNTILTHTCFKQAKNLDLARTVKTYLDILQVQKLVVTGQGQDKDFSRLNLRGINLQGANLANASFINSDLSNANLKDADLSRAKLVQTQLDKTDFTGANLTGAYIENWRITRETKFDNVRCKYVYIRVPTKDNPNQFRKPDNKQLFADGEFGDFIKSIVDNIDI